MTTTLQMTGMLGVYLVAAELTRLNLIVSPTLRNAAGADLLATRDCEQTWSIQVKASRATTRQAGWEISPNAKSIVSETHIYVFVWIPINGEPSYLVVPNKVVVEKARQTGSDGRLWFARADAPSPENCWTIFDPL